MINFEHPKLLIKYKSWIGVQVAFYDFIFMKASNMCPECFTDNYIKEFKEGANFYEKIKAKIKELFPSQNEAWRQFLEDEEIL